jgi:hypothetical protein
MESICGQGFAYAREVEEDRQISSQTRARKCYKRQRRHRLKQFSVLGQNLKQPSIRFFYIRPQGRGLENGFHKTLSPKYYTCMSCWSLRTPPGTRSDRAGLRAQRAGSREARWPSSWRGPSLAPGLDSPWRAIERKELSLPGAHGLPDRPRKARRRAAQLARGVGRLAHSAQLGRWCKTGPAMAPLLFFFFLFLFLCLFIDSLSRRTTKLAR